MRDERGAVLLEVMVALVILATAGVGLVETVGAHLRAVEETHRRERDAVEAEALLARLALRDRKGLDLRIGRREEAGFVTEIQRPRPGLYRLSVRSLDAPERELFVTAAFRPEPR